MSNASPIFLDHQQIAEILVKNQNIHEGLWGIAVEFGLGATNAGNSVTGQVHPAAVIPVLRIGLQRFDAPSNLTVDAAKVNPLPKTTPRKKSVKHR